VAPACRGGQTRSTASDVGTVSLVGTTVVEVSCRVCPGVIDRVPAADADQAAVEHFAQLHPGLLPVAGEHYLLLDATPVCDACLALLEPPWWEHLSTPPTPAAGQEDRDGRWMLCDPCHDLWTRRALAGWVRRAWTTQAERAPWLAHGSPALRTDARAHLAGVLRQLLERLDDGRRITLG
jgi:hypothetical protein